MTLFAGTPGQTVGPFFGYALPFPGGAELVPRGHPDAMRLHGRVLDGAGEPVPDALLEIWQTDTSGAIVAQPGSLHRDGWTFTGWGRAATNRAGEYSFTTVLPRSAFIAMALFARGLLDRLYTRVYLPGDDAALAADPLLAALPPSRRATLIAAPTTDGLAFDVVLQGEQETVFLEFGHES